MPNLAGMLGWIVVVGYIGTLALYAYTFGIYAADLFGAPDWDLLRMVLAALILIAFMAINLMGVREIGISEDILVYTKIILLAFLGVIGFFSVKPSYYTPVFNKGWLSILAAGAIIFVAYEGFQLITNTVCETVKPDKNIPRGIYLSIVIVIVVYTLLTVMSIGNLTPEAFNLHGEYALAVAVSPILGKLGRVLVDISAILATSSAINATLFGASRMSAEIAMEKMMPKAFSFRSKTNVPWVAVITITSLAFIFTYFAELEVIAIFSSATFIVVCIGVTIANIKLFKKTRSCIVLLLLGLALMMTTLLVLISYLFAHNPHMILFIISSYIFVIILELFVSQRRIIKLKRHD